MLRQCLYIPPGSPVSTFHFWSIGSSSWTWGRTSSLWGWWSTGTGCPERLWILLLWRYSRRSWTKTCATCSRWPCFGRRVELDDPQRSLTTPNFRWFLYASFLCFSLVRSSLFIHAGLLPPFAWFRVHWCGLFLSLEQLEAFFSSLSIPDSTIYGHCNQGCLWSARPQQQFLLHKHEVQQSVFLPWFLSHQCQAVISAFQKPPGLPMLCCVALPADTEVAENPCEEQDLWAWGFHQMSEEGLPQDLLFLYFWSGNL